MNAGSTTLPRTHALILAGGQGERLFPLTVSRPKPAVSFGGMFRIIDFTLSNCLHSKLKRVSVLTQYRHEQLHAYLRQGWSEFWNQSRHERNESSFGGAHPSRDEKDQLVCLPPTSGKRYRGTADAVFQNLPVIQSEEPEFVLILSGDHVYHMDYRDLIQRHLETNADLTIANVEHPAKDASPFGVVEASADFRVTGFAEKPRNPRSLPGKPTMALISMGVYIFKREVLVRTLRDNCDAGVGHDFGRHIIPSLIPSARVYAYDFRDELRESPHYWRDIGTLDSFYEASMDLLKDPPLFDPYANDIRPSQPTRHPVSGRHGLPQHAHVNPDSRVARSVLSTSVHVEEGAEIEGSVLMPGVRVGQGARIRRAIIEEGIEIPKGFQVGFDLDRDRNRYTVSPAGVVVVGETINGANLTAVSERSHSQVRSVA